MNKSPHNMRLKRYGEEIMAENFPEVMKDNQNKSILRNTAQLQKTRTHNFKRS